MLGNPYKSTHKRLSGLRSPGNKVGQLTRPKLHSPSSTLSKFKRRSIVLNLASQTPSSKPRSEAASPTHHIWSSSVASLKSFKDQPRHKLGSLSPAVRSNDNLELSGASLSLRSSKLHQDLIIKLNQYRSTDVIGRSLEALKALQLLKSAAQPELRGLLTVVSMELGEMVASRQVLDRKLDQLSRENYGLSKQLEANSSLLSADQAVETITKQNLSLKSTARRLESQPNEDRDVRASSPQHMVSGSDSLESCLRLRGLIKSAWTGRGVLG
jgi:hypothetical protein